MEDTNIPRCIVTLTNDEIQELKVLVQKGGKGYRIRHVQILLKLDQKLENEAWTYDRIKEAYGASIVQSQVLKNVSSWMVWRLPSKEKSRKTAAAR